MKFILTESQLKLLLTEDRVEKMRDLNVVTDDILNIDNDETPNTDGMSDEEVERAKVLAKRNKVIITPIQVNDGSNIAYVLEKRGKKQIKLTETTFNEIVDADPSRNKQYVQWIIDVFKGHALHNIEEAVRFIDEDLDQATDALVVFECVKNRKKFKLNAPNRQGAPENPKDIRQYKSVGQLYGVISAFSCDDDDDDGENGAGGLSKKGLKLFKELMSYQKLGQAKLDKLSERMLIYQPQTLQSSCEPLGGLSNWCTRATPTGGVGAETGREYFHNYRGATGDRSRLRPGGELSDYYVIMPIELFQHPNPSTMEYYPLQFHFESGQLHDNTNRPISDSKLQELISSYPELGKYFRKELGKWAGRAVREGDGIMGDNKYITYLNKFGGSARDYIPEDAYTEGVESIKKLAKENRGPINKNIYLKWLMSNEDNIEILDYIPLDIQTLDFTGINLGKLPDLSMFKEADEVNAYSCNLTEMPKGSDLPPNITILLVPGNQITNASFEGYAENLQNIRIIRIDNNPIKTIDVENLQKLFEGEYFARFIGPDPEEVENNEEYQYLIDNTEVMVNNYY